MAKHDRTNTSPEAGQSAAAGVTTPGGSLSGSSDPDDVARRAYEIFCERGCHDGRDIEDWLQAEDELRRLRRTAG